MARGIIKIMVATAATLAIGTLNAATATAASDTGWVPVGPYPPDTVQACGTTLTVSDKVNKVEQRTREDDNGNVRSDYRGTYVVRVVAENGRRTVLDNSGPFSVFEFANETTFVTIRPPAFIYAFDDVEAAAFKRVGLPTAFYYTKGRLDLFLDSEGREKVVTKPKDPVSICKLLR